MEKLILRGVMYGADKIPDTWFEKVPGGFYRAKEEGDEEVRKDNQSRNEKSKSHGKSSGGNGNSNGNGSRPSTGNSGSGGGSGGGRNRRYSTGETMRPSRDDYGYDDGNRSDRRRSGRKDRSSYDGPDDDEDYYNGDDRHRRRRHQGGEEGRRRRSYDNYDRYGDNDDGYGRSNDRDDGRRANGRPPYPETYGAADPYAYKRPDSGVYAAAATAGGAAAAGAAPYPPSDSRSPPPSNGAGVGGGYVPYAHIYGQSNQQAPQHPFSPPPASSSGSVQPNGMNQVAPQSQYYHQNPYAQEAAAAAAGAAAADATYNGNRSQDSRHDSRYDDRGDGSYDRRYDDRHNGYDENDRAYSHSPPRQGRGRRQDDDDSFSRDSYYDDDRRARSERRPAADDPKRAKSQRGKSRIRERFDTSQRGLGYGAVGALAGGLVGSELGKGPIPTAIAAAVGAIGANAFEARERYVDPRKTPGNATTVQTQHRAPDSRACGSRSGGGERLPPPPPRRREAERSAQYEAEGMYGRRDSRRKSRGYESD